MFTAIFPYLVVGGFSALLVSLLYVNVLSYTD